MELTRLARAGKRLEPVFIVGEARSGTSLLYRLLQQQPAFGPDPPQLSETDFMNHLLRTRDLESGGCWKMRTYLLDDAEAWRRFKSAAAPLLAVRAPVLLARRGLYAHPRAGRLLGAATLARAYLAVAAEARGVTRLVEKTPSAAGYSGHLLAWFPGARILYIHRHPVDVLSSYWRRAGVDQPSWKGITVESFAARYAARSRAALDWAQRRPDAVRLVRYEALVTDPAQTIGDLCAFAGAPFDPSALATPERKGVTTDPYLWEDPTPQTKEWADYITDEQAADLENRLAPVLEALEHPRYTSG